MIAVNCSLGTAFLLKRRPPRRENLGGFFVGGAIVLFHCAVVLSGGNRRSLESFESYLRIRSAAAAGVSELSPSVAVQLVAFPLSDFTPLALGIFRPFLADWRLG